MLGRVVDNADVLRPAPAYRYGDVRRVMKVIGVLG